MNGKAAHGVKDVASKAGVQPCSHGEPLWRRRDRDRARRLTCFVPDAVPAQGPSVARTAHHACKYAGTLVSKALALLVMEYRILVVSIVCGEQRDDSFGISQQCDSLV